ncbi:hypothetical protein ACEQPO_21450 [Bacillus sp. SL00103]
MAESSPAPAPFQFERSRDIYLETLLVQVTNMLLHAGNFFMKWNERGVRLANWIENKYSVVATTS